MARRRRRLLDKDAPSTMSVDGEGAPSTPAVESGSDAPDLGPPASTAAEASPPVSTEQSVSATPEAPPDSLVAFGDAFDPLPGLDDEPVAPEPSTPSWGAAPSASPGAEAGQPLTDALVQDIFGDAPDALVDAILPSAPVAEPVAAPARKSSLLGAASRGGAGGAGRALPPRSDGGYTQPVSPPSDWGLEGDDVGSSEPPAFGGGFSNPEPPSPLFGFGDEDLPTAEVARPSKAGAEVNEPNYVATGDSHSRADSTDADWHREPTPPPVARRGVMGAAQMGARAIPPAVTPAAGPAPAAPLPFVGDDDLFGGDLSGVGFGGPEEPPTEEVPSAVLQDLSHLYNAPMDMPGPAPIPGLFGDETPPPVPRHEAFATSDDDGEPAYVQRRHTPAASPAPTPPRSLPRTAPPKRAITYDADDERLAEAPDEDDTPFGLTRVQFFGLVGAVVVVAAGIIAIALTVLFADPAETETPAPAPVVMAPAPVQQPVPVSPAPTPAVEVEAPEPDTEAPAPVKAVTPAPVRAPRPAPVAKPPPARVPAQGTVKIRANKTVFVLIDGEPENFAPVQKLLPAGEHKISALLPGKEESKQTVTVTVQTGKTLVHEFSF